MVRLKALLSPTYPAQFAPGEDILRRRILESLDPRTRLAIYPYKKTSLDELAAHADRLLVRVKATPVSDLSESSAVLPSQIMINEMFESRLDGIDQVLSQQYTPATNTPLQSRRTPNPAFPRPPKTPFFSSNTSSLSFVSQAACPTTLPTCPPWKSLSLPSALRL